MKVVATIQARMGSSRLPGKVLRELCGTPMLVHQVNRLLRSRLIDDVVVATTTNSADDVIADLCALRGISVYRGSEQDVLARVAAVVTAHKIDLHVECFGDSPLVDPQIVDEFLGYFLKHRDSLDGVSSTLETTYPPGLEVLAYWGRVIVDVNGLVALDDPLREHAGFNIGRFPRAFRIESLRAPEEFHEPELYLEVDTIEDFEVVAAVFEHFKARGSSFGLGEILGFLRAKPEIPDRNRAVERRWRALRENDV